MDVIYLHGPPAAGKLTVANELAALGVGRVFHNHLTMDAARPFFDFGSAPFWALVQDLRFTCLRAGSAAPERSSSHRATTIPRTCRRSSASSRSRRKVAES